MHVCLSALLLLAACGGGGGGGGDQPASTARTSASNTRVVPVTDEGLTADSPDFQRLYGPGVFNINALANTVVGTYESSERLVANRFLATVSAPLVHARILFVTGRGYSGGTGGTIRVSLHADDGSARHLPALDTELASTTVVPTRRNGSNSFPQEIRFEQPPALQAGQLYHLVFRNVDPDPAANFVSVDHAATISANGRPARWLNTRDWSVEYATRPAGSQGAFEWRNLTRQGSDNGTATNHFSPIMELGYGNGQVQGVGDMESGSVVPERIHTIDAGAPVRERFSPTTSRTISGLSLAAATTTGGSLQWRLKQGDTELAAGQIEQPAPNYRVMKMKTGADGRTEDNVDVTSMHWYDVALPTDIRLDAGKVYDLELTPAGNSRWVLAPHRNGQFYSFKWPAAFTESRAQHTRNGRWLDTFLWDKNRTGRPGDGHNWPVVLHLAP